MEYYISPTLSRERIWADEVHMYRLNFVSILWTTGPTVYE